MIVPPKAVLSLLTLIVILCVPHSAKSQEKLSEVLLRAYNESTKELVVGGERVRGHEIGNNKFRTCNGDVIEINNRPLRKSDKCREPSLPANIPSYRVAIMGWDEATSLLDVRKEGTDNIIRLYVPESATLVTPDQPKPLDRSKLKNMDPSRLGEILIFQAIPERIEAISFTVRLPQGP